MLHKFWSTILWKGRAYISLIYGTSLPALNNDVHNEGREKLLFSCVKDSRVQRGHWNGLTSNAHRAPPKVSRPPSLPPASPPMAAPLATLLYAFYLERIVDPGRELIYLNCFPNFHSPPLPSPRCALDTITDSPPPLGEVHAHSYAYNTWSWLIPGRDVR